MKIVRVFLPLIIFLVLVAPALANPDTAEEWFFKGCEFGEKGQYVLAVQCYDEALALKRSYTEAWYRKGDVLEKLGCYEDAIQCFDKVLVLKPNYAFAWYEKGFSLGQTTRASRDEEAIKCYDKALALNPDFAEAWYRKGDAVEYNEEAIKCYEKALALKPDYAEVWDKKGHALDLLCEHEKAIQCFDKALALKPDLAKAWSNKGNTLFNLGRYEEAIQCFDKALVIKPDGTYAWDAGDETYAWHVKGWALFHLGRYEEAIQCFDKVLALNLSYYNPPEAVETWNDKGMALEKLGKLDEAMKCYVKAMAKAIRIGMDYSTFRENEKNLMAKLEKLKYPKLSEPPVLITNISMPFLLVIAIPSGQNNNLGRSTEIVITVENKGAGEAYEVTGQIEPQGNYEKFSFPKSVTFGNIKPGEVKEQKIIITTKENVPSPKVNFTIKVTELNGFDADPVAIPHFLYDWPSCD
ncbi:MAG: tetratricopeptide repeat protein [bacterium]